MSRVGLEICIEAHRLVLMRQPVGGEAVHAEAHGVVVMVSNEGQEGGLLSALNSGVYAMYLV